MALHETITPSGIRITFEDGEPDSETGKSKRRCYLVNGDKLPSVTTILGCLDKPGLTYGAEKVTIAGAIALAREGELPTTVEAALSRMKSRDLRFWQVWRAKADRGTVTHDDLVRLATGQEPTALEDLRPDQRAFAQAIAGWYADERPVFDEQEVMVASAEHGFAGRHDLFGVIPRIHPTAKVLLDLKTTEKLPRDKHGNVKPPYPEHLFQLGGYELGRRECGYEPSDYQAVLRVDASGEADLFPTVVDPTAFVAVLGAYRALKGVPVKPIVMEGMLV